MSAINICDKVYIFYQHCIDCVVVTCVYDCCFYSIYFLENEKHLIKINKDE